MAKAKVKKAKDDTPELDTELESGADEGVPEVEETAAEDEAGPLPVAEEPPHPDTHIYVDGAFHAHPEAKNRPRRLMFQGRNIEHTGEELGCWAYRSL